MSHLETESGHFLAKSEILCSNVEGFLNGKALIFRVLHFESVSF